MKLLSLGFFLIVPLAYGAPTLQKSTTVKDYWVKTLLHGVAAGAWPDNPVKLADGRIFFHDGQVEQVTSEKAVATLHYDQSTCPDMNGSFALSATSDQKLVVGFNPVSIKDNESKPVLGLIDPDTGHCQVLTKTPEGSYLVLAITVDRHDTIYYAAASNALKGVGFYKFPKGASPVLLFTVPKNIPDDIAVDSKGNLYASWYSIDGHLYHNQITVWKPSTKKLSVYAGIGLSGKSPNGTLATQAALGDLYGIAIDSKDNLYIAQEDNPNRISMVDAESGRIYHFAGNGLNLFISTISLSLHTGLCPRGITVTPQGNLIYTDIRSYEGLFSDVRMIEMSASDFSSRIHTAIPDDISSETRDNNRL
ncbi:hypothetical protein [Endozoicomonas arenosclerae]|uniref:hypothetical protein n=1 Tax=Endozoicomonas arenosclerae TaxID=1633495 RepID=UPI000785B8A0|nr:hypothetical protein [Endozoicomonas arenosclerae]